MPRPQRFRSAFKLGIFRLLCMGVISVVVQPVVWPGQHDMRNMPEMRTDPEKEGVYLPNAVTEAKRLADKQESEFNHHLAGLLVILAGLIVLFGSRLSHGSPWVRQFWPICFVLAGLFLLVFSDTEIWPFGSQTLWYAVTHEPEDLQHKVFALILLTLGIVEYQRVRGRWKTASTVWVFPIVGLSGALLLLFHSHSGETHDMAGMEVMAHIQVQHWWYAAVGAGVGIVKGMSEFRMKHQKVFSSAWPILLVILGLSLMLYTE